MNLLRSLKSWNGLGCIVGEKVRPLLNNAESSGESIWEDKLNYVIVLAVWH